MVTSLRPAVALWRGCRPWNDCLINSITAPLLLSRGKPGGAFHTLLHIHNHNAEFNLKTTLKYSIHGVLGLIRWARERHAASHGILRIRRRVWWQAKRPWPMASKVIVGFSEDPTAIFGWTDIAGIHTVCWTNRLRWFDVMTIWFLRWFKRLRLSDNLVKKICLVRVNCQTLHGPCSVHSFSSNRKNNENEKNEKKPRRK